MGTGMLSSLKSVPVPCRAALIVVRQFPDLERRGVVELRGQRQQRCVGTQRLGEVHHAQLASSKFFKQLHQDLRHSVLLTNHLGGEKVVSILRAFALDHERFSDWIYRRNWKRFSTKERSVT